MMKKILLTKFFIALVIFVAQPFLIYAQSRQYGDVIGRIYDQENNESLPGATVIIQGLSLGATTDRNGRYRLNRVPVGEHTLEIRYVGFENKEMDVNVRAGEAAEITVSLTPDLTEIEGITITGNRFGQAQALSRQRSAGNIKNIVAADLIGRFPDQNVAEALQRVPGITITRDQGEGRYVQIRGTNPNLNSVSINGEQIPSPEGDVRFVALDVIPANVLSSIEVNKTITPDMDGDAVGGSINLNTLAPRTDQTIFNATLAGGYNNNVEYLSPLLGQVSAAYGKRVGDAQKFGFLIGGSYDRDNRSTDNNEMEYDEGELQSLVLQDYEITRIRTGVTTSVDYRFNPASMLFLNAIYNRFSDQEYNRTILVEPTVIERELKDRYEAQTIFSLSAGGEHSLTSNLDIDYMLSYSYAGENTSPEYVTIYNKEYEDAEGESVEFMQFDRSDPNFPQYRVIPGSPEDADPLQYDNYSLDLLEYTNELTEDRHFTSRLNLKTYYNLGAFEGEFKFGGLFRTKKKSLDPEKQFFTYEGDRTYRDLLGDFEDTDFMDGRYTIGLAADPDIVRDWFSQERNQFESSFEDTFVDSEGEDYTATEDTYAGYLMTNLRNGPLNIIAGFRYENTRTAYSGNTVEFDEEGELIPEAQSTTTNRNFDFFLPMINMNYNFNERTILRLAWTNTFAKPNYFDLAPYRIINREDEEIALGNPDLLPTRSTNLDLMAEYYFSSVGILSGGVFYKDIRDFRYTRLYFYQEPEFEGFEAEQPVNGNDAQLAGVELNWQQQLTFLPGFLSGFGIFVNYTYTWSEAELFGETNEDVRTVTLPGQNNSAANFALSYEKGGFNGRIAANYNGAFVDELRDSDNSDRFYDERLQLDFSASQQIIGNFRVFLEVLNLTNAPLRYYNGVTTRPEQQEYYSWWTNFGIKYDL